MNVVIVGQGAMGLLWYQHISQLGALHNLSLLPSEQPVESNIHYYFTDVNAVSTEASVTFTKISDVQSADIIILCLKSFQVGSALNKISMNLNAKASIVLTHNGMGTLEEIPHKLREKHTIFTLLTTHGCLRAAPYNIIHTGIGVSDFGLISGEMNITQQLAIASLLNSALPEVSFNENIKEKQWLKLAINCVINPLTALNDIENGVVNTGDFTEQIQRILTEVVLVAKADKVVLSLTQLTTRVQQVALATAKNSSSMRCDVLANKQTEIDYINGYIHNLGLKYNIATPENTHVWQQIKSLNHRL